jgi:hypothetical protein
MVGFLHVGHDEHDVGSGPATTLMGALLLEPHDEGPSPAAA